MILIIGAQFRFGFAEIEYTDVVDQTVVNAQDTTGAGDTFNSAFAVARCEGRSLDDSIRFANAAAALSVQKLGAQGGMPYLKDVERMLGECKK